MVILDGAPDVGKKTALSDANKPYLDQLASHSYCGVWSARFPKNYSITNFSDIGTLQLLGCYDYPGRGYLEALGIGLKPDKNSVYLRVNFATVKLATNSFASQSQNKYKIVDRRAGRDETGLNELTKEINKIHIKGAKIKFYRGVGHRGILVLSGKGLSWKISEADRGNKIEKINPLDKRAKRTSDILNEYVEKCYQLLDKHNINNKRKLAANFLLLRGVGHHVDTKSFKQKFGFNAVSISGVGIVKGVSKFLGIKSVEVLGATGHINTDLNAKIDAAIKALRKYDFVVLHINGADECAHDKNSRAKKEFIEKVDRIVFSKIIKLKHINIVVTSDHITSSKTGMHVKGNVPFLIYNPEEDIDMKRIFSEHMKKDFVTDNPMNKILLKIHK